MGAGGAEQKGLRSLWPRKGQVSPPHTCPPKWVLVLFLKISDGKGPERPGEARGHAVGGRQTQRWRWGQRARALCRPAASAGFPSLPEPSAPNPKPGVLLWALGAHLTPWHLGSGRAEAASGDSRDHVTSRSPPVGTCRVSGGAAGLRKRPGHPWSLPGLALALREGPS